MAPSRRCSAAGASGAARCGSSSWSRRTARCWRPLLAYIDATESADPLRPTTIVLAEFVPRHFWEYPLHNQTALRLKLRLFFRPNTVVVDVPFHLRPPRSRHPAQAA